MVYEVSASVFGTAEPARTVFQTPHSYKGLLDLAAGDISSHSATWLVRILEQFSPVADRTKCGFGLSISLRLLGSGSVARVSLGRSQTQLLRRLCLHGLYVYAYSLYSCIAFQAKTSHLTQICRGNWHYACAALRTTYKACIQGSTYSTYRSYLYLFTEDPPVKDVYSRQQSPCAGESRNR